MKFYSVRELRNTPKAVWESLDREGTAIITNNGKPAALMLDIDEDDFEEALASVRQVRAMTAFRRMRRRAAEKGFMSNEEIEAEIKAAREEKTAGGRVGREEKTTASDAGRGKKTAESGVEGEEKAAESGVGREEKIDAGRARH